MVALELGDCSGVRSGRIWDILEAKPRVIVFADVGMKDGVFRVIQLGHPLLLMPISRLYLVKLLHPWPDSDQPPSQYDSLYIRVLLPSLLVLALPNYREIVRSRNFSVY